MFESAVLINFLLTTVGVQRNHSGVRLHEEEMRGWLSKKLGAWAAQDLHERRYLTYVLTNASQIHLKMTDNVISLAIGQFYTIPGGLLTLYTCDMMRYECTLYIMPS